MKSAPERIIKVTQSKRIVDGFLMLFEKPVRADWKDLSVASGLDEQTGRR